MSATYRLFERWMAAKGIASERAALRQLGVSATVAQHWKNGRNGSLAIIEKMADDLGEDYVPIVMQAFTETAPNEPEKKAWRRLAKRVGGAVVLAAVLYSPTPEVTAATSGNHTPAYTLCEVRRRGRSRRKLRSACARVPTRRAA